MTNLNRILSALAVTAVSASLLGGQPALADGAASTRNIIIGGAAVAAGTLILINHNKQVHERYAQDAQRQAALQSQANDAQGAYESERSAYQHEVAINSAYKREVSIQHQQVVSLERQLSESKRTAAAVSPGRTAFVQPASVTPVQTASGGQKTNVVALGWGTL
jgi:hypothetical protein